MNRTELPEGISQADVRWHKRLNQWVFLEDVARERFNSWAFSSPPDSKFDHYLPSVEEYALAKPCYYCKADAGQTCTFRNHKGKGICGDFHATRWDKGNWHRDRDIGRCLWPEYLIAGLKYDTLGSRKPRKETSQW